jgi:hypothetical protein
MDWFRGEVLSSRQPAGRAGGERVPFWNLMTLRPSWFHAYIPAMRVASGFCEALTHCPCFPHDPLSASSAVRSGCDDRSESFFFLSASATRFSCFFSSGDQLVVPEWMLDEEHCRGMPIVEQPLIALSALSCSSLYDRRMSRRHRSSWLANFRSIFARRCML